MFIKKKDDIILSWVENNDLNELGNYLVSGSVHGKPGVPVAELQRVEKLITNNFSDEEQYQLAKKFIKRNEYTSRNIGVHLIISGWPKHKDVAIFLKNASDDENWIVREYAAGAMASLLKKDFSHFSELYLKWIKSESVNVKRAVALAVKYESKAGDPKKWKSYFKLINPLMKEEAEYIRVNLGPFAIGDGLLSRYPDQILNSCKKWINSPNENVRWNTAMIFTAASARQFAKEGKELLSVLEKDSSVFVVRALKKAQKNLDNRNDK